MNTNPSTAPGEKALSLQELLDTPVYPFRASIALGGGRKLELSYRSAPASATEAVKAYFTEALSALGIDPKVALRLIKGHLPTGEKGAQFQEAINALGDDADEKLQAIADHADGLALSLMIGSWNLTDAITPQVCAALPGEVKKAIVRLSEAVELPAERLSFLGSSGRV